MLALGQPITPLLDLLLKRPDAFVHILYPYKVDSVNLIRRYQLPNTLVMQGTLHPPLGEPNVNLIFNVCFPSFMLTGNRLTLHLNDTQGDYLAKNHKIMRSDIVELWCGDAVQMAAYNSIVK